MQCFINKKFPKPERINVSTLGADAEDQSSTSRLKRSWATVFDTLGSAADRANGFKRLRLLITVMLRDFNAKHEMEVQALKIIRLRNSPEYRNLIRAIKMMETSQKAANWLCANLKEQQEENEHAGEWVLVVAPLIFLGKNSGTAKALETLQSLKKDPKAGLPIGALYQYARFIIGRNGRIKGKIYKVNYNTPESYKGGTMTKTHRWTNRIQGTVTTRGAINEEGVKFNSVGKLHETGLGLFGENKMSEYTYWDVSFVGKISGDRPVGRFTGKYYSCDHDAKSCPKKPDRIVTEGYWTAVRPEKLQQLWGKAIKPRN